MNKTSHMAIIITSLLLSRSIFFFIDDPEGPNLLIVSVLALFIYIVIYFIYKLIDKFRY
jgi:amino acid permease